MAHNNIICSLLLLQICCLVYSAKYHIVTGHDASESIKDGRKIEDSYLKAYHEQHQPEIQPVLKLKSSKTFQNTKTNNGNPNKPAVSGKKHSLKIVSSTPVPFYPTVPQPEKQKTTKTHHYKVYEYNGDQDVQSSNDLQLHLLPTYKYEQQAVQAVIGHTASQEQPEHFVISTPHYEDISLLQNYGVNDIKSSLNALLGKSPNAQLQQLKELIKIQAENPTSVYGKTFTPIQEKVPDVMNLQHRPNIVQIAHITPQMAHVQEHLLQQQQQDLLIKQQQEQAQKALLTHQHEQAIREHNLKQESLLRHHEAESVAQTYQKLEVRKQPKLLQHSHLEQPSSHESDIYAAKYAFGYRVRDHHTGNDFGHEEHRDGEITKGHYHVLLPDGRLQNVNYQAGPNGYHAVVTYQ